MVEIEGAFLIGMISAINYLAFSRLLELVRIDDMVSEPQAAQPIQRFGIEL